MKPANKEEIFASGTNVNKRRAELIKFMKSEFECAELERFSPNIGTDLNSYRYILPLNSKIKLKQLNNKIYALKEGN